MRPTSGHAELCERLAGTLRQQARRYRRIDARVARNVEEWAAELSRLARRLRRAFNRRDVDGYAREVRRAQAAATIILSAADRADDHPSLRVVADGDVMAAATEINAYAAADAMID